MLQLKITSLEEIDSIAQEFIKAFPDRTKFAFYGSMGVGKTTFIKSICKALGMQEIANSPTFALINEYPTQSGELIYHFDFYRINKIEEAYDFGYEEYFYSDAYCFIEWPEKIEEILPEDVVKVFLTENADGTRSLNVE
jgi:tRNA threonylcarbamoyladenosine biosynthesis protein TsaE